MSRRTLAAVAGVVVGLLAVPAGAAPSPKPKPKPAPITGKYTAGPLVPDPTMTPNGPCNNTIPGSVDQHEITVTGPGTLKVALANMLDYSLAIRNAKGKDLATSDGGVPTDVEKATAKIKTAGKYYIWACNDEAEPTVDVTFTFTYS